MFRDDLRIDYASKLLLFVLLVNFADSSLGVDYGKHCDHDDDCHDFRLVCSLNNYTCVCSRFFVRDLWNSSCYLNTTELKLFLSNLEGERDYREELDNQARVTFNKLGFAGILSLSLGLLGAACCVISFCVIGRKTRRDSMDKMKPLLPTKADPKTGASSSPEAAMLTDVVDGPFDMACM